MIKNLNSGLPIYRNAADIPNLSFKQAIKAHFVVVKTKNTPALLGRGLGSLRESILSTNPGVKPIILVVDDSDHFDLLAANRDISREHSAFHHPVKARLMRQMLKGNRTKPIDILCRDYSPDRRIKKPYGGVAGAHNYAYLAVAYHAGLRGLRPHNFISTFYDDDIVHQGLAFDGERFHEQQLDSINQIQKWMLDPKVKAVNGYYTVHSGIPSVLCLKPIVELCNLLRSQSRPFSFLDESTGEMVQSNTASIDLGFVERVLKSISNRAPIIGLEYDAPSDFTNPWSFERLTRFTLGNYSLAGLTGLEMGLVPNYGLCDVGMSALMMLDLSRKPDPVSTVRAIPSVAHKRVSVRGPNAESCPGNGLTDSLNTAIRRQSTMLKIFDTTLSELSNQIRECYGDEGLELLTDRVKLFRLWSDTKTPILKVLEELKALLDERFAWQNLDYFRDEFYIPLKAFLESHSMFDSSHLSDEDALSMINSFIDIRTNHWPHLVSTMHNKGLTSRKSRSLVNVAI